MRTLIDAVGEGKNASVELQAEMCQDAIAWCVTEKRTFLRQRIQARLAGLLLQMKKVRACC